MCTTCGCGNTHGHGVTIESGNAPSGGQRIYAHDHGHGDGTTRLITLEADLLAKNAHFAAANRARLAELGALSVNLVSSPGSGKTTLLACTAANLKRRHPVGVIEGDQQTSRDAERVRAAGVPAVQINTGRVCHLDAHMVGHAIDQLALPQGAMLFIENVGNLVCPASFDLGEDHKVVVISVTEGEDKPLKYPDMFAAADLMIVNKVDLLPHVEFDVARCVEYAMRVNPDLETIELSATQGMGLERWYAWLEAGLDEKPSRVAMAG